MNNRAEGESPPVGRVIKTMQDCVQELEDLSRTHHITPEEQRALRNIYFYLGAIERGIND